MATQRTSTKVTRTIEVPAEELEQLILRHFTNGIGTVKFRTSVGGYFDGVTIIATTEVGNKTDTL